jgi:hypothetical protein
MKKQQKALRIYNAESSVKVAGINPVSARPR